MLGENLTLVERTYYTVSYDNNIKAGENTAKVIITGKGIYEGTAEKTSAVIKYTVDEKKNTAVAEKFETEISAGEYSGTVPVKENIYSVRFGEKQEGQTGEDAWLVNFGQNKVLTGLSVSDKNYISEFYMYK